jgi:UDP-glucuronate decarboxylase
MARQPKSAVVFYGLLILFLKSAIFDKIENGPFAQQCNYPIHRGDMNILVTGGAGFVGSHLIDVLMAQGHHVICVDDFSSGRIENVSHHIGNSNFEVIKQDIRRSINVASGRIERIYNLACPASPKDYRERPIETLLTCVIGVHNLLELAEHTGARLLQVSSSEVYGDAAVNPQPESYLGHVNQLGDRACYEEGKRAAETLCKDYSMRRGVDVRIVRPFNIYGPRMACGDGRVIPTFIAQALASDDITVFGDGSQTRSFCFFADAVDAIIRWMETDADYLPVNIGNPEETTIADLAQLVKTKTGSRSQIVFVDRAKLLPGSLDIRRRKPDISKMQAHIGWVPTTSLDEGLDLMIADFRSYVTQSAEPEQAGQ